MAANLPSEFDTTDIEAFLASSRSAESTGKGGKGKCKGDGNDQSCSSKGEGRRALPAASALYARNDSWVTLEAEEAAAVANARFGAGFAEVAKGGLKHGFPAGQSGLAANWVTSWLKQRHLV